MKKLIKYIIIFCFFALTVYLSIYKNDVRANKPIKIDIINKKAINFKLKDINDKTISLSDYKNKVIFLNFWATWCVVCKISMPSIKKLNQSMEKENFVILSVNVGENKNIVSKFAKSNNLNFNILLDNNKKVTNKYSKAFNMNGIPTTFIIDKELNIIGKISGYYKWEKTPFTSLVKKLTYKTKNKYSTNTVWNDSMYEKYSYKKFYKYKPPNKKINFDNINYKLMQASIFYETNLRRIKNKRKPFMYSLYLKKAAQMHADDMKKLKFFSHYSPVKGRKTPGDRIRLSGHKSYYSSSAENITQIFGKQYIAGTRVRSFKNIPPHTYISFAKSALNGWMNSPIHRRNILNKKLKYLGTGVVLYNKFGPLKFFGVQVFSEKGE